MVQTWVSCLIGLSYYGSLGGFLLNEHTILTLLIGFHAILWVKPACLQLATPPGDLPYFSQTIFYDPELVKVKTAAYVT